MKMYIKKAALRRLSQTVDKAPNELYSFGAFLVSMILKFQRFRVICDIINV